MNRSLKLIGAIIWYAVMIIIFLIFIYPFIYSLLASLMTRNEFGGYGSLFPMPKKPTIMNYQFAFSMSGAARPLINSIIRATWYSFVIVSMSVLCGYVLARYNFKGKKWFIIGIVASQVVPNVLTLIPSFLLVSRIPFVGGNNIFGYGGHGLINNYLMLFLPISWNSLLYTFLFMQTMKTFPTAFEEAAEIDGYGFWGVLLKIVLPMNGPIMAVIAINVALANWNDWLRPFLYINRATDSTLTAWLATLVSNLQEYGDRDYPKVFALSTLAVLPPFFIFLYFQKFIIQGLASVGIKG
jgi:multiple sugar transport system permease protein